MRKQIAFNRPFYNADVLENIKCALESGKVSGDGAFTKRCSDWFENIYKTKALLTTSGTAALEMAALLIETKPGDEIIMPSYTFVSTANAFVLRGAIPVFVDIRRDNCNINEQLIEYAITAKTKAIVPVHYAGVACDMDVIMAIAEKHNLYVIEDAAQAFGAFYKGKRLGTIGHFGCLSFHETKNISCGEGGALLINDASYHERSEIIREKGTNRSKFFRGQVDKYNWVGIGSSYLPSDILASYLYVQLELLSDIEAARISQWKQYQSAFQPFEANGLIRLPVVNEFATNNAHMFYLIFKTPEIRTTFIAHMRAHNIIAPFHYVPLHSSPAGRKYCRTHGELPITDAASDRLVRFPLFYGMEQHDIDFVINSALTFIKGIPS